MTAVVPAWRITGGCRLHWRAWGEESIVYDAASGDTHLLDPLSAEVLKALERSSMATAQLAELLGARLESVPEGELSSHISALLPRLHDLGLIESVPQ